MPSRSELIDFRQGEDLREDALKALIRAGVERNAGKPKPVGRKR